MHKVGISQRGVKMSSPRVRVVFYFALLLPYLFAFNSCLAATKKKDAKWGNKRVGQYRLVAEDHRCLDKDCEYVVTGKFKAKLESLVEDSFLLSILKQEKITEGFALLSYGGWTDDGQKIIFMQGAERDGSEQDNHDKSISDRFKKGLLHIIPPKPASEPPPSAEIVDSISFNPMDFSKLFETLLELGSLPHFAPKVFDNLEYEYIHALQVDKNVVEVSSRVYMKSYFMSKDGRYKQLIETFKRLAQNISDSSTAKKNEEDKSP